MRLEDVILRGTRVAQPAANSVAAGSLYFVLAENVIERSNGTNWESYSSSSGSFSSSNVGLGLDGLDGEDGYNIISGQGNPSGLQKYVTGFSVDGAGSVITTGVKGFKSISVSGTIISARLLANISGSAVVDIWKDTYANYPPTIADTITAAALPTIVSSDKYEDTTLTGWTTIVTAGDILGFNVNSAAIITRLSLELIIRV